MLYAILEKDPCCTYLENQFMCLLRCCFRSRRNCRVQPERLYCVVSADTEEMPISLQSDNWNPRSAQSHRRQNSRNGRSSTPPHSEGRRSLASGVPESVRRRPSDPSAETENP